MGNRFDEIIERRGTASAKWDGLKALYGNPDAIPLWVADMDFRAPDCVVDALVSRAAHGIFGYVHDEGEARIAAAAWMQKRHGLVVSKDDILVSPGVVDSIFFAVKALLAPGERLAIQTPVYGPFFSTPKDAGAAVVENPLLYEDGRWSMDLAHLRGLFEDGVRAVLISSPHNPVGRVWTTEELTALAALCREFGAVILSDEIHSDIILPGHKHTPILMIDDGAVQLISASKTFSLASLRHSSIVVKDAEIREKIQNAMAAAYAGGTNLFGMLAQTAAYEGGEAWLEEMLLYLDGTREMVEAFFGERLPEMPLSRLEGTYLMWIDMRALSMTSDEMVRFFAEKAGVALSEGRFFGETAEGFMRMNIATPRANVQEALERIDKAVRPCL